VTKNRCSTHTLVLSLVIGSFLICAATEQAVAAAGPVASHVTASVRAVQPAVHGLMQLPTRKTLKRILEPGNPIGTFSLDAGIADGCVGEVGNLNNPSCTSNDVQLTAIEEGSLVVYGNCTSSGALCTQDSQCPAGQTCDGAGCSGASGDTITFSATGIFSAGSDNRYDLGLFISTDTETIPGDGAIFGNCVRWGFSTGETGADLDQDVCGDLNKNTEPHLAFGPVTVPCVDADGDGLVDVWHCETWANNPDQIPAQNQDCNGTEDIGPGTGAKCNCGLLPGACIPFPDENECTLDVCLGTCSTSGDVCADTTECPSGETCEGITLQHLTSGVSCDDNNSCTTDSCDPATGCVHTPISCDDNNSCTTDACDPATGCTHSAVSCDDNNSCTTDACDPATGCTHSAVSCDDNNSCTTDACDPAAGCTNTPVSCGDNNACTTDACDPATGCTHSAVSCEDNNACTTDACDPAAGCTHSGITCNDNNVCTIDTCDPTTGCVYTATTCNEGCTPGFWKRHVDLWGCGYTRNEPVANVFDTTDCGCDFSNLTFFQALSLKGGSTLCGAQQTLYRAGIAAILSACSVDYTLTTAQIISEVNTALASCDRATILLEASRLDAFNNLFCPLP
jgi:Dictyostelium (slime mold) repeat